ncbi:hypothetical protein HK103_004872 [Boothiomyces macroporosus]|uniref:Apple domain-containing protein n=1 Tax=Boothiomyces macroporosus TaxID=261099 RepID=A0AAD5UFZ6_9FUNG|nr:hypothetical protein HK103_004872 [Boothiomyces macroporosus]
MIILPALSIQKPLLSVLYYGAELDLDNTQDYAFGIFNYNLLASTFTANGQCNYASYKQCVEAFKNETKSYTVLTFDSAFKCCLYTVPIGPLADSSISGLSVEVGVSLVHSNCSVEKDNWMSCNGYGKNSTVFNTCLATLYSKNSSIYIIDPGCSLSNAFDLQMNSIVTLEECMEICHNNQSCQSNYWVPLTLGSNTTTDIPASNKTQLELGTCNLPPTSNNGTVFADVISNNCVFNGTTQKCKDVNDVYNRYPMDIYLNGVAFRKDFYSPFYVAKDCTFRNLVNVQVTPTSTTDCKAECLSNPNCSHFMNLFASCFKFSGIPLSQQIVPRNTSTCYIHEKSFDCLFNESLADCVNEFQYQAISLNGVLLHENEHEFYGDNCNITFAQPSSSLPEGDFAVCRENCLKDPDCKVSSFANGVCDRYTQDIDEKVNFYEASGSSCQIVKSRTDMAVYGRNLQFNLRKGETHNPNDFNFGLKYQNIDILNLPYSPDGITVFHYFTNTIGCEWIEQDDRIIDTALFIMDQQTCAWLCYMNVDCTHFDYEFTENYSYGTCSLKSHFSNEIQLINNPSIKCGSLTERNACIEQDGKIICDGQDSQVTQNNFEDVFFNGYLFSHFQDLALNYKCHWKNSNPIQSTPINFGSQCAYLCQSLPNCTFYDWIRTMEYNTLPTCNLYGGQLDTSLMEPSWHECGWKMSTSNCKVVPGSTSLVCANSTLPSVVESTTTQATTFIQGTTVVHGTTVANATLVNNGSSATIIGGSQVGDSGQILSVITDAPTLTENLASPTVTVVETIISRKNEERELPPSVYYSVTIGALIGSIFLNVLLVAALVKFNKDLSQSLDTASSTGLKTTSIAQNPNSLELSKLPSLTNSVLIAKFQEIDNKNRTIAQVSSIMWSSPVSAIYLFANQEGMAAEDVDQDGFTRVSKGDCITLKLHSFDGSFLGTNETKELVGKFPTRIIPPPKECPKLILVHCPEYEEYSDPAQYEFFENTKERFPQLVSLVKVEDYLSLVPNQYFSSGIFQSLSNIKIIVSGSHDMMRFIYTYMDSVADEMWSYIDTSLVTYDYDIADDNYPFEYN